MPDDTQGTARVAEVCRYLRTKSVFLPGDDGPRNLTEPSSTAVYWCNRTGGAMGPYHDVSGPFECAGHRGCYAATRLLVHENADSGD